MKQTKKGFTLVELLVVIAILAILATVSVVGYTTFIEKANRSVDEQAVAQINTALMAANIPEGSVTNIAQVQALMDECNLEIEDYKPLSKDKFFFYDTALNRVIYTDNKNYTVLYPQDLIGKTDRANWFSLSGEISLTTIDTTWVNEGAGSNVVVVTASTAEQLYTLSENITKYAGKTVTINIQNDINMMGAALSFSTDGKDTVSIIGPDAGAVLANVANTEAATKASTSNSDRIPRAYGGGLFAEIASGDTIVMKNITISGATIGDSKIGNVGAIVGRIVSGGSVTLENCHIKNSVITGQKKVGSFIGFVSSGSAISMSGCSVENVTIQSLEGESGTVAGTVQLTEANCESMGLNSVTVTNSKVEYIGNSKSTTASFDGKAGAANFHYSMNSVPGIEFFAAKTDADGYRPFASDAKYFIQFAFPGASNTLEPLVKFVK